MGVVELDGHFIREGFPVGVVFFEAADDVAQRAGDEEVLLDEAKFLSGFGVVVRVKHLTDRFRHVFLLHGLLVAAAIEGFEIKLLGGLGFPQAKEIHRLGAVAGNRNIVGNADELAEVRPHAARLAKAVGVSLDMAVNWDFLRVLRTNDFPWRAVLNPGVGEFHLVAVAEFLFEETVFVVDAVADGGEVQRREGVEKTSCQAAETAVAEGHVVFLVTGLLKRVAQCFQGFRDFFQHTGVDHVVHEKPSHEEFHREIVNPAHIAFRMDGQCFHHALDDDFLNGLGSGDPPFTAGG